MRSLVVLAFVVTVPCRAATAQQAPTAGANRAALYAGATMNATTDFTLAFEYVRRPADRRFGVGGFVEMVLFAHDAELLLGITGDYFVGHLVLETGPGFVTFANEFFWRVGAGYEIKTPTWFFTPKAYVDFIAGTTFVGLGVAAGREF